MSRGLLICLGLSAAFCLLSCEDIITVDLKDAEPKLVIEGYVNVSQNDGYFRLSRTTSIQNTTTPEAVSGAEVVVFVMTRSRIVADTFHEYVKFSGIYRFPYAPLYGQSYRAQIKVDDVTYSAEETSPPRISLDSLRTIYSDERTDLSGSAGYKLHVYFRDPIGSPSYMLLWLNSHADPSNNYPYTYDGTYSDGKEIDYELKYDFAKMGDVFDLHASAIDKNLFDYYTALQKVIEYDVFTGMGIRNVTPTNPVGNWDNGALGYFGVFNVSRSEIQAGK